MSGDFFLTRWAFLGMQWLYETLTGGNIVLTIVVATLAIRLISLFGDIKSRQSSLKMQSIQPELDKIRKKYANDSEKLARAQQKLMRDNNVSMFGGCLPMLITMPLFFIFFAAFRQWGQEMMAKLVVLMDQDPAAGLEFFKNFRFLWVNNVWMPDNGLKSVLQPASEFFSAINKDLPRFLYFTGNTDPVPLETFLRLGFFTQGADGTYALASASEEIIARYDALMAPCLELYQGFNNGWFILPVLAGATSFLQSWLMSRGQPQGQDAAASSNKMMLWLMPVMSVVFCLSNNSAFAVYWIMSNVFGILTNVAINRVFLKKKEIVEVENK